MKDHAPAPAPLDLSFLRTEDQEKTRKHLYSILGKYRRELFKLSYSFNYSSGGVFYFPVLLKVLKGSPFTVNSFAVLVAVRDLQPSKAARITSKLDLWHFNQVGLYLRALREQGYIRRHRHHYSLTIYGINTLDKLAREYYDTITRISS